MKRVLILSLSFALACKGEIAYPLTASVTLAQANNKFKNESQVWSHQNECKAQSR